VSRRLLTTTTLLAALLLCFLAASAGAADLKIGFIDSGRIFQEYQGTKEAQTEFNSQVEQWNKDLEAKKQDLQKMQDDYDSQALILSEPKRREKEEDIQKARSELDAFVQDIWGPSGQVAKRNEELTRPIVEKIREVLTTIGRDEGFSIIFDATDGNVVYADDALDLTDRVIAALNAQR
jgi:outer membrane protein